MLQCRGLSKTYTTDHQTAKVLTQFNLDLKPGSFNILIGSNGAGKSTLVGLITGNVFPDEGQILVDGHEIQRCSPHERQGYIATVHQNTSLGTIGSMTIMENMALVAAKGKSFGLQKALPSGKETQGQMRKAYAEILQDLDMGLEKFLDTPVKSLSGGQRQALTLAMSLLTTPKLLLLDEHTAALDPKTSERIMALTARFVETHHITTLMITHDLEQAIQYGDRLILLESGKIALDLSGQEKKALQPKDLMSYYFNSTFLKMTK